MLRTRKIVWAALLVALLAYLSTAAHKIRPGEQAVVRRFGKVLDVQPRPGLWIGLPWGMDRVDKVAVDQVRQVTVGYRKDKDDGSEGTPPGQLITGDQNLVNVQIVVSYAVDPEHVVDYVLHKDRSEEILVLALEAALADWVGGQPISFLLAEGKSLLPQAVVDRAGPHLKSYHVGVQIRSIAVALLTPPSEVKEAFDGVNEAAVAMQAKINNANQQARVAYSNAEQETYRWQQEAETDAQRIRSLASSESDVFRKRLADYQQNPGVRMTGRWEAFRQLMKQLKENGKVRPIDANLLKRP